MVQRKRVKKNKHRGMTKKAIHNKKPMCEAEKLERKKIRDKSKKMQKELNKKLSK